MTLPQLNEEDRQSLEQILEWLADVVAALLFQQMHLQRATVTGSFIPARYFGMTEAEVEEHFDQLQDELQLLTRLNLVACAEAAIKSCDERNKARLLRDVPCSNSNIGNAVTDALDCRLNYLAVLVSLTSLRSRSFTALPTRSRR